MQNGPSVFHAAALAPGQHQTLEDGGVIFQVVRSQHGLDGFRGFFSVVKRHGVEQVVSNMGVRDVMKHVVQNGTKGTINRRQRPAQPIKFILYSSATRVNRNSKTTVLQSRTLR
jgi:hypothetical protein